LANIQEPVNREFGLWEKFRGCRILEDIDREKGCKWIVLTPRIECFSHDPDTTSCLDVRSSWRRRDVFTIADTGQKRGTPSRLSSIGWYSRSPRTPSNPSQMHSDFHSRIEHKPLQGLEVKAAFKVRLDGHQFINSLLDVIRVAPIEYQHSSR
jgi:hypothetical protein